MSDTTLPSDNPFCFRNSLLEIISKPVMTIDDKIRYEKLWYDIDRETAKISTISWGKIDKSEYLTSKKILPSDQSRMIER